MKDHRIGLSLFTGLLDTRHQHGFARGDHQHADRAIFIGDPARTRAESARPARHSGLAAGKAAGQ